MKLNIVLYQPEIPENTGNIMRTCVGFDMKLHLIRPLGFHLDENRLKRSCLDYYMHVKYELYDDFNDFFNINDGYYFYLTRYGKKPISDFNFQELDRDIYLIFGKESTGLPYDLLANNLDNCFRLPMTDKIRSLNLSNTVAISSFEVLRQLDFNDLLKMEPEIYKGPNFLDQFKN